LWALSLSLYTILICPNVLIEKTPYKKHFIII
jgi:hypothetical protein